MKFGKNLTRNQVPEWSHSYINYSPLKKLIGRVAVSEQKEDETADTTEFFYFLDRNLEEVDFFYNKKFAEDSRRLKLLNDQYGKTLENPAELDRNEVEDLIGGLLELRDGLRKLQWYGEVNRRGFVKITKKLDKKVPSHSTRQYVESKVDTKSFSSDAETTAMISQINDWLSKAGDAKRIHEGCKENVGQALPRVSAKAVLEVSRDALDQIDLCLRNDDVGGLSKHLDQALQGSAHSDRDILYQRLQLNLLQRAITCQAMKCIAVLLGNVRNLEEGDDFNQRNCLHRFILSMNRAREADSPSLHPVSDLLDDDNYVTPAAPPLLNIPSRSTKELSGDFVPRGEVKSTSLLNFLLDHLSEAQRSSLAARDNSGKTPLHYAAQFGFVSIVTIILTRMLDWNQFERSDGIDAPFWQDSDGLSPLHSSVMGEHYNTTKALLQAEDWRKPIEPLDVVRKHMGTSGEVLALAVKRNSVPIVKLLLDAGVDVNYEDDQGETALHVAARYGQVACTAILLDHGTEKANLEVAEKTFGWTPLFIACVDGHQKVVEILLGAGANPLIVDVSGWRPSEHATLRGHLKIAEALVSRSMTVTGLSASANGTAPGTTSLGDRKSYGVSNPKTTVPVKTFGHRCLTDETLILVSLGSMDMRKNVDVVTLDRIPLAAAHKTQLDTALSVVVSASGATGEPEIVDLPVQENIATEPIEFMTKDASKVKILFDIVPTYAGAKDKIVGRGVALLGTVKPSLGSNRISLQGDLSVPIVSSHNLEVIGCVNFNFLIVTPFHHPNISIADGHTYWKSLSQPLVIGHRGLGKNQASRHTLQLGENTIQSFIAAANLGAQYVEFDVQLTKDHVPVIYHDFLVSETGIDAPVHTLTLEQFMHVSDGRTPRDSRQNSPNLKGVDHAKREPRRGRSLSIGANQGRNDEMNERMKHTRDFKEKGFKGNSRSFIQAPFTTLEEMFTKVPEHVGFNIEVKYPMLHESEEQEMDTYAVEINHFVDTVLKKIFDLNKHRNILMSSFNPDICTLLSLKQPSIPILFLTDAGIEVVGDIRASSLQEAIRFASRWNLLGIVAAAEPFCLSPRLVQVVKESGLICVSYGTLNNDSKMVKLQVQSGIDAVIVDSVLAIRKGLTEGEGVTPETVQAAVENATSLPESPPPTLSTLDNEHNVDSEAQSTIIAQRPESSGSHEITVS